MNPLPVIPTHKAHSEEEMRVLRMRIHNAMLGLERRDFTAHGPRIRVKVKQITEAWRRFGAQLKFDTSEERGLAVLAFNEHIDDFNEVVLATHPKSKPVVVPSPEIVLKPLSPLPPFVTRIEKDPTLKVRANIPPPRASLPPMPRSTPESLASMANIESHIESQKLPPPPEPAPRPRSRLVIALMFLGAVVVYAALLGVLLYFLLN